MPFSSIFGHGEVIHKLEEAFRRDHLPTAYLFRGPQGVGKGVVAKALAQMLNCRSHNNCGHCPSCRLLLRGEHPDFHLLCPQGKFIKISQIQELIAQLSLKPSLATKRVVLLKHADKMNAESANAFLKILEEPPLDTLLILTAVEESLMLETLLSRCQKISFAPLGQQEIDAILQKDFHLAEDCRALVLRYSQGCLRREFIAKGGRLLSLRSQALHMLLNLHATEMEGHFKQLEGVVSQNLFSYFLEFLAQLLKDLLSLQLGFSERIVNRDLLQVLREQAERWPAELLEQAFLKVIATEINLLAFAAKGLGLEALIVDLKMRLGSGG